MSPSRAARAHPHLRCCCRAAAAAAVRRPLPARRRCPPTHLPVPHARCRPPPPACSTCELLHAQRAAAAARSAATHASDGSSEGSLEAALAKGSGGSLQAV